MAHSAASLLGSPELSPKIHCPKGLAVIKVNIVSGSRGSASQPVVLEKHIYGEGNHIIISYARESQTAFLGVIELAAQFQTGPVVEPP